MQLKKPMTSLGIEPTAYAVRTTPTRTRTTFNKFHLDQPHGRAVAQLVIRWLPTAASQVRVRAEHGGIVADKLALGQVFSEYFGCPCQS
jgi:hypothetical protein